MLIYQLIHAHNLVSSSASLQMWDRYRVLLYIDGFIVEIQRPDHAGDAFFCGRHGKSCDSINVQYLTDKDGRIRHVITGVSGSTHDKTAASWSVDFMTFLDNLTSNYVVLGDPAYRGLHPRILTTFTGPNLSPSQQSFNDACTRLRQVLTKHSLL
jgi:DDE superfamily endonuclease